MIEPRVSFGAEEGGAAAGFEAADLEVEVMAARFQICARVSTAFA